MTDVGEHDGADDAGQASLADMIQAGLLDVDDAQALIRAVLFENADGLLVVDADGLIRLSNRAAEELFGAEPGDMIGQPFGYPVASKDAVVLDIPRGGNFLVVEMRVTETQWRGGTVHIATLRDISDRHEAEEALRSFVSMASHELKTPLTTMMGFASTMRDHWTTLSDERKLHYLEVIELQAARLGRLADDLLRTARMDAGASELHLQSFAILPLIKRALIASEMRDEVEVLDPERAAALQVVGDPDRVEELVINYLTNARKYGAPPYQISVRERGRRAQVSVIDHGPGVNRSFAPQLFTRFSRDSTRQVRDQPGSGLGLAIVRSLARSMNGDAGYRPNPAGGSIFSFTLPIPGRATQQGGVKDNALATFSANRPVQRQTDTPPTEG